VVSSVVVASGVVASVIDTDRRLRVLRVLRCQVRRLQLEGGFLCASESMVIASVVSTLIV
jgi:hypothetical protein